MKSTKVQMIKSHPVKYIFNINNGQEGFIATVVEGVNAADARGDIVKQAKLTMQLILKLV